MINAGLIDLSVIHYKKQSAVPPRAFKITVDRKHNKGCIQQRVRRGLSIQLHNWVWGDIN